MEQITAAWEEMKERGISRADIKAMNTLGYSFGQTVKMWSSLETKEDKHFFACLIQGQGNELKYIEAFEIDPNELSYGATIVMSDYACRLLEKAAETGGNNGFEKNFIAFNNALLRSTKVFNDIMPDGTEIESLKTYRDVYLERIYAGTAVLLDVDTGRLLEAKMGNMTDEEYKKLVAAHEWKLDMCGYWAMQRLFIGKEGLHTEDNQFYIADITNYGGNVGGIDFNLGYYSVWDMSWEIAKIDMTAVNSTELGNSRDLANLKALREAKENLLKDIILKTAQSGTVLGISYVAPGAAIFASIGTMMLNGSAGTVTGLDSLTKNKRVKLGLESGNILAENGVNYVIQLNEMSNKLNKESYQILMEWLGKGVTYSIDEPYNKEKEKGVAFTGFYDPEKLYTLSRLETEGLAAMGGWGEKNMVDVIKMIEAEDKITNQVKEMSIAMIKGGYHAIKKDEDTYTVVISDMEVFLDAVYEIEEKVKSVNKNMMPEGVQGTYFQ